MRKKKCILIYPLCYVAILFGFLSILPQEADPAYAFVTWKKGENIEVWIVDYQANPRLLFHIPFPEGFYFLDFRFQTLASPNGKYLILKFRDRELTRNFIQSVNIDTGEITEVAQTPFISPLYFYGEPTFPVWSPDSRYLAFSAWPEEAEISIPYIYIHQLDTQESRRISTFGYPVALAWSPDSTQLAVLSHVCPSGPCQIFMEVFSIPRMESDFLTNVADNNYGVPCHLSWSPDGKALSYLWSCGVEGIYSRDVYIYNIAEKFLFPATNFTTSSSLEVFESHYDLMWYDPKNLFIGANVRKMTPIFDPDASFIGTISYQLSEANLLPLASDVFSEWSINPLTKEVAFRAENMVNFETVGASVRSARFDGQNLVTMWETPAGCNLQWSPDGDVLAYENRSSEEEKCLPYGEVKGIILVQRDTGEFREYLFPFAEDINVSAAGWVLVP